jgi:hypothetical protein
MTKTKLVGALSALVVAAAPGVALAHGNGHHQHKQHAKHHARKAKVRVIVHTPASSTTPSSTTPAPAVTASITKFENGDLTITLSNGKAYTAAVTDRTRIECEAAAVPTARASDHGRGDDDNAGDDDSVGDDDNVGGDDERGDSEHGDGDHNDDGHPDNGQVKDCGTAALTAGTQVSEAKLVIDSSGATWKKLELVK